MKQRLDLELLDELRKKVDEQPMQPNAKRALHELLTCTWSIAIGANLRDCELKRAMAYRGCVAVARTALDVVTTELNPDEEQ